MHIKILQFWNWFTYNEAIFRNVQNAEKATELLNNQVLSFGKFAWGIDEGTAKPFLFTFSPNGDKKLLFISKKMVELAPDLPYWEFRYCRPALVDWDFEFEAYNQFVILQQYDASEWQFVLIEEEDYRIHIDIKVDNLDSLDFEDQIIAADRAVTYLLGEEMRIEEVHSVGIVHQFDPQDKEWVYSMKEFKQRFLKFIE